jgi:hypothetical protein
MSDVKNNCMICNEELVYADLKEHTCSICKNNFSSQVTCKNGHYVCDKCHINDPVEYLEQYIQLSNKKDPIDMLSEVMNHNSFKMHGPEHHYLIPAIFLTAIKNSGYETPDNYWQLVLSRCSQLPGGTCGYWGACSCAIGTGVTISILTNSNPLNKTNYGKLHLTSADAINEIGLVGGPRCCKRNTLISAFSLLKNLSTNFNITLDHTKFICSFLNNNKECIGNKCEFFPKN